MKEERFLHCYTRLQTGGFAVFLAEDEVENLVVNKRYFLILDNETIGEETRLSLMKKDYDVLKEFFESTHGKELMPINTDELDLIDAEVIPTLDTIGAFVCIDKTKGDKPMYIASLVEKGRGTGDCTMEVSEDAYKVLKKYCVVGE